jgi:hypothetical protein
MEMTNKSTRKAKGWARQVSSYEIKVMGLTEARFKSYKACCIVYYDLGETANA